jgi:hypothetical protein
VIGESVPQALFWLNPADLSASTITRPNLFIFSTLPAVLTAGARHRAAIYWFGGLSLVDRTRSGFSGLLGSFWAVLGLPQSSGKSPTVLDFAGESSTFSVEGFEFLGRFNSLRLHHLSSVKARGLGRFFGLGKDLRLHS